MRAVACGMTATKPIEQMNETENQMRLRRAKESLTTAREMEMHDRKRLNDSIESAKRAKEKYEALFMAEEMAEVLRLKKAYNHTTN